MNRNEDKLFNHPWIKEVSEGRIRLKTKYKIRLFTAWKREKFSGVLRGILEEAGLGEEVVGDDFCRELQDSFTMLGFPKYSKEDMSDPQFKEENPLVLSGKFIRDKSTGSADMTEETREKLYSVFPDIPIMTALSMNEIDSDYLGVLWVQSCSSRFYRRLYQEVKRGAKEATAETSEKLAKSREIVIENLRTHPYVKIVELNGSIEMKDAFYNEIMLLDHADIDELLSIYEKVENAIDFYFASSQNIKDDLKDPLKWRRYPELSYVFEMNELF